MKLNVLMFGFDSISKNTFIRKLPKSYDYLVRVLKGHVLQGYNIVGDGTPQALIPILTGKTELELPDTRKRFLGTHYVDVYPFIWKDFKLSGYVTGFLEDVPDAGTFTYRLNGFKEPPTDHYMTSYYAASSRFIRKWPKRCHSSVPVHKVMLNYIRDFFKVYKSKPKFMFGFHGELSHDSYNLIGVADNDLLEFLKDLKKSGALDDTLLILMADHGHRFAEIRNTIQGKQEERLPFFSFTFPPWFKRKHKEAYDNFVGNVDKLTTPFDVYLTFRDVIDYRGGRSDRRAYSLFRDIPENRSCADAYIESHWCACLQWELVALSEKITSRLSRTVEDSINAYVDSYRDLCERLRLVEVEWVMKLSPNKDLLKFNANADRDGFVPDMSADMKINRNVYQLKVRLMPGDSIFEASVTHFRDSDEFVMKMSDVSRVNAYGSQARCIMERNADIRKYCYCKD